MTRSPEMQYFITSLPACSYFFPFSPIFDGVYADPVGKFADYEARSFSRVFFINTASEVHFLEQ